MLVMITEAVVLSVTPRIKKDCHLKFSGQVLDICTCTHHVVKNSMHEHI